MPNHTWFCVLDIDGMDALVNTRHYCDTATATPAKAKKMAALIENWTPPDGWCNGNDDMREKLEAAEKRIAELEEREILLPERSSMLHRTDFHDDYQTVMAYKVSEVIDAIRATGIRIKGE